ncbi:MAG TPA: hypothetical protein VI451_04435 [Anaerolineales bacterium]|nr:hypothetical protein [Anaerolineales bacterium]
MSKRKERREKAELFAKVRGAAQSPAEAEKFPAGHDGVPVTDDILATSEQLASLVTSTQTRELPRMKKFRFQLLHAWIVAHLSPSRVADVGGGKGLLAYLLQESGWQATVIDPISQDLPAKFKDLSTNRQTRIPNKVTVPRLVCPFELEMAGDFDLLVAMHAHGCNIQLIRAAAEFGREAILLPCCVIGEPLIPPPGVHWIQALVDVAVQNGFTVEPFRLNFKGQNIGLYLRPRLDTLEM